LPRFARKNIFFITVVTIHAMQSFILCLGICDLIPTKAL